MVPLYALNLSAVVCGQPTFLQSALSKAAKYSPCPFSTKQDANQSYANSWWCCKEKPHLQKTQAPKYLKPYHTETLIMATFCYCGEQPLFQNSNYDG